MPFTLYGTDGTVDELQWAHLTPLLGTEYSVEDLNSYKATQVAGQRALDFTGGRALGQGVVVENLDPSAGSLAIPAPSAGQFSLITLRRNWVSDTAALQLVPGATTSSVVPSAPPATYPADRENRPGVLDDQPLYWAWVNAATTTVTLFDLRTLPIDERIDDLETRVSDIVAEIAAGLLPVGTSIEGHWTAAPAGFLLEQGQLVSRTTYPALFAVLGTRYNIANDPTTQFRLPDPRGRVAVAKAGSGTFGTLGGKTGAETVALTAAQMPNHNHTWDSGQSVVGFDGGNPASVGPGNGQTIVRLAGTTSSAGSGQAHSNLQPSIVVNRAIKY